MDDYNFVDTKSKTCAEIKEFLKHMVFDGKMNAYSIYMKGKQPNLVFAESVQELSDCLKSSKFIAECTSTKTKYFLEFISVIEDNVFERNRGEAEYVRTDSSMIERLHSRFQPSDMMVDSFHELHPPTHVFSVPERYVEGRLETQLVEYLRKDKTPITHREKMIFCAKGKKDPILDVFISYMK